MALETPSNAIGRIDVNQLVRPAEAVVEPRATALLADAFRQGVVTADDIVSRIGELGKSKEKAEIMAAKEAVSPEAQALRAQQTAAGTAQAGLAQAQAERQRVLQEFPAVAYFDKLAPAAGIVEPKLPDGTPDYKQMERIGAELAVHEARKKQAQETLDNINRETSADGSVLFAATKQGQFVDPKKVQQLQDQATRPFMSSQPLGSIEVSPLPAQAPSAAAPVVEPRGATSQELPPAGQPFGGGISLGPPKAVRAPVTDPVQRANALAVSQSLLESIGQAKELVKQPGVVGPGAGSLPMRGVNRIGAIFGIREDEFENQRELEILISKKVLEGAQAMKGNLSDKDIRFLKDSVPKLSDTPQVWDQFLNTWNNLTQQNIAALSEVAARTGNEMGMTPQAPNTPAAPSEGAVAPVKVTSPEQARNLPPGTVFITPDGQQRVRR